MSETTTQTTTEEKTSEAAKRLEIILDPDLLFQKQEEWRVKGWHVLTPATRVSRFGVNWGASINLVLLDSTVDPTNGRGSDTYFDKTNMAHPDNRPDDHERGISRVGLMRLAQCAGADWNPLHSGRTDPRTTVHLWEYRMVGLVMGFDGTPLPLYGTGEIDYRDGSAQIGEWSPERWKQLEVDNAAAKKANANAAVQYNINGWSAKRVLAARSKGLQRCETNAMERAIRTLGLQHAYTVGQLKKPFVVLRATYLPDMEDPDIRQMVAENALRGTRALFAQAHQQRRPIPVIDITPQMPALAPAPERTAAPIAPREVVPVAASAPTPATAPIPSLPVQHTGAAPSTMTRPAQAPPVASTPQPGDTAFVRDVTVVSVDKIKVGEGTKGTWTLHKVTFSDGKGFTTLDDTIADDARKASASGGRVDYKTKQTDDGKYTNLVGILPAGAQPSLLSGPAMQQQEAAPVAARDLKW